MEYRRHPLRSKPSVERALVEGDHPHQPHIAEKLSLRRPGGGSKRLEAANPPTAAKAGCSLTIFVNRASREQLRSRLKRVPVYRV
jgi:hypothetical protein